LSVIDLTYRTITCDGCQKTVTFQNPNPDMNAVLEANPWLKNNRMVQTASTQKMFSYCSSLCEIDGLKTGSHDFQEAPKVAIAQGSAQAQIAAAAAAAKAQEEASKALKAGGPIQLK
jgi:hypothetical protein